MSAILYDEKIKVMKKSIRDMLNMYMLNLLGTALWLRGNRDGSIALRLSHLLLVKPLVLIS